MPSPTPALVIAPLWKRGVAHLVDALPFFALALATPRPTPRARRRRGGLGLIELALSAAYHIPLTATRGQTLGQRVLGIRVVDAVTAAVPTPRQSAVRWAVAVVPEALVRFLPMSARVATTVTVITDLQPEIDRLTQLHAGDRKRLNQEVEGLFEAAHVKPIDTCLPFFQALPGLALSGALYGPALRGPRHQTLHDRLAGTVVVEVDGATPRPRAC